MIINQINYGNSLSETTATSKDIAYDKIGYSSSEGKIVGTAPFDYNENYKILNTPLKLTTKNGYSGLLVEEINNTITWTQTTLPTSTRWYSVCYGDGKYVAVAYNSKISAYSTDGITWTQTTLPINRYWQSVCYGDGKYVAVDRNSNIAAYSCTEKYSIQMLN